LGWYATVEEMSVNKGGLVTEVSRRTDLPKADVAAVVDAAMAVVKERVAKGEHVSLVGFGTFQKQHRNKRIARNPRKPDVAIVVPARDVPQFVAGKAFKDALTKKRSAAKKPAKKSTAKKR
jgi:DNA-binding protein HU-beta